MLRSGRLIWLAGSLIASVPTFLDPLSEMFDQLDQCLEANGDTAARPLANVIMINNHI